MNNITESALKCDITESALKCDICYDTIHHNNKNFHRCPKKCNSQYHKLCAKKWSTKTNTCPFCRSDNFYELPDLSKFFIYCCEQKLEEIYNLDLDCILHKNTLFWACKHGHIDIVRYLVEFKDKGIYEYNNYALQLSSENGHIDIVKYILEFRDENNNGLTIDYIRNSDALKRSSSNGHIEVVRYLCEFRDDNNNRLTINDIRSDNNYALINAIENGHIEVVRYLLEFRDDNNNRLDINDIRNRVTLSKNEINNGHIEVIKYLLEFRDKKYVTFHMF